MGGYDGLEDYGFFGISENFFHNILHQNCTRKNMYNASNLSMGLFGIFAICLYYACITLCSCEDLLILCMYNPMLM